MVNEILDHEEYYNDDEQDAYEHGLHTGADIGFWVGFVCGVILLVIHLFLDPH